jgi:hypothetical protein
MWGSGGDEGLRPLEEGLRTPMGRFSPPATRRELFTRFGPVLKSPWRSPSEGDLQGEIDVCENRDIILFWWLVVLLPPALTIRANRLISVSVGTPLCPYGVVYRRGVEFDPLAR